MSCGNGRIRAAVNDKRRAVRPGHQVLVVDDEERFRNTLGSLTAHGMIRPWPTAGERHRDIDASRTACAAGREDAGMSGQETLVGSEDRPDIESSS
jgi:hypothetical protein